MDSEVAGQDSEARSSEIEDGSEKQSEDSPETSNISVADGDEKKDEKSDDVDDTPKEDQKTCKEQQSSNPLLSKKARLEKLKERRVSVVWVTITHVRSWPYSLTHYGTIVSL